MTLRFFRTTALAAAGLALAAPAAAAATYEVPVSLRGSSASMARQNELARLAGLVFVKTRAEQRALEADGGLVRLEGNADYGLIEGATAMLARDETRRFVERLAAEYRAGCGERLVVTSATRPAASQPRNAHALSVHPAGVAVDLRVSRKAACRQWLEQRLLGMERARLLDVTREYRPPHYHVAIFPRRYAEYDARLRSGLLAAHAADVLAAPVNDAFAEPAPVQAALLAPEPQGSQPRWPLLLLLPIPLVLALRRRSS